MKSILTSTALLRPALAGLALAGSISMALAVADRDLGTFDSGITGSPNWGTAWGNGAPSFDATQDATGNGGGSCRIAGDFAADQNTMTVYGLVGGNPWWHPNPPFNMAEYKSLEFDIKWDNTSTLTIAQFNSPPLGGEGGIVIWSCFDAATWPTIKTGVQVPAAAADGWAHVSVPIDPAIANLDVSYGIVFKKWIQAAQKDAGGTYAFWVDNVTLKGTDAPPPPPTMGLEKAVPGMAFIAASGGQYDRQNIRTVASNYTWIGASGPVSYSIDVAQHAPAAYNGFQLHMYLVPGDSDITRPDCDWHEKHVVMWRIVNQANGTAWADLNYKTNAPDSNGILYGGGGGLGGVGNPTPTGLWTLTFTQNTNLTITTPGGATYTTNFPPGVIEQFSENPHMQIAVGVVPGELTRLGQKVILKGVKITGTPGQPNVDSQFVDQALNTNIWSINASSPTQGVQPVPSTAPFWLSYTLPAQGFSVQSSDKLVGGTWGSPTLASFSGAGKTYALLGSDQLPGANAGFYRMLKRVGTKLQVLLPGETAAPGTPTGKTGTPTPQTSGLEFDVVVRLVDNNWYPVTAPNDLLRLRTNDDTTAVLPPDANLLSGTVTFKLTLWLEANYTITVTDQDNPVITPGTAVVPVHY